MPTHLSVPGESSSSQALVEADKHDSIPEIRLPDEEGAGAGERRVSNVRSNLIKIRKSFRDQAHTVRQTIQQEAHRIRRVPRWVRVANTLYHDWGLKHACLIGILIIYNFIGAAIFFYAEASNDVIQEDIWIDDIAKNRTKFVDKIIPSMFNNSDFLFFLTGDQTKQVEAHLNKELSRYEMQLGVKYKPDQKIKWDFWNAMLYAQTLCTTIGDAQLYCVTKLGRILSMIYATIGIPLVLSVLDDMGGLIRALLGVVINICRPRPQNVEKDVNKVSVRRI
uniref:Ion_trans_2 domain-containing protein n=1 Tax=Panagrellus redivivus TaxID=6233 RepID=A0A7E4VDL1_PANRE